MKKDRMACRICGKKKKYVKFDHGRGNNCKAVEDACVKCVKKIRKANRRIA